MLRSVYDEHLTKDTPYAADVRGWPKKRLRHVRPDGKRYEQLLQVDVDGIRAKQQGWKLRLVKV